jgi:hypothetical protein
MSALLVASHSPSSCNGDTGWPVTSAAVASGKPHTRCCTRAQGVCPGRLPGSRVASTPQCTVTPVSSTHEHTARGV